MDQQSTSSILIFLPGYGEIQVLLHISFHISNCPFFLSWHLQQELYDTFSSLGKANKFWLLPLHSTISSEEQNRVFNNALNGLRKVPCIILCINNWCSLSSYKNLYIAGHTGYQYCRKFNHSPRCVPCYRFWSHQRDILWYQNKLSILNLSRFMHYLDLFYLHWAI